MSQLAHFLSCVCIWDSGGRLTGCRGEQCNPCDFISHTAPRPMMFPTADRRWKPLPELSVEESSLSSVVAYTDRKKNTSRGISLDFGPASTTPRFAVERFLLFS